MAVYRKSVNFIPGTTKQDAKDQESRFSTGLYAALLPMFGALIWLILVFVGSVNQSQINDLDAQIRERDSTIASYARVREEHTELVKKVEALKPIITKDFEPNQFFLDLDETLKSSRDAKSAITSFERDDSGTFTIIAQAGSYLDLAKLVVVFEDNPVFGSAIVDQISLNQDDTVNFKLTFEYKGFGITN